MWWKVFISKWLCSTNFQFLVPLVITRSSILSIPNGMKPWIAVLWIQASRLLKRWFPECTWENWQDKSLLICVGKVNAIYFNVLYSQKATKFDEISIFHLKLLSSVEKSLNISSYFLAFSEYMNLRVWSITICLNPRTSTNLITFLSIIRCELFQNWCFKTLKWKVNSILCMNGVTFTPNTWAKSSRIPLATSPDVERCLPSFSVLTATSLMKVRLKTQRQIYIHKSLVQVLIRILGYEIDFDLWLQERRNVTDWLNDGAKRNRLLYLKTMYTSIRKILHLP